tara:strand:+ start:311 stop:619 length:309 start_codon:yes stop_codon:yes gene_type:complete
MIYTTITDTNEHTLVTKSNNSNRWGGRTGGASKISVSNVHASASTQIVIFLEDANGVEYTIAKFWSYPGTTTVVSDNVSFDGNTYSLKIKSTVTSEIDVIVK